MARQDGCASRGCGKIVSGRTACFIYVLDESRLRVADQICIARICREDEVGTLAREMRCVRSLSTAERYCAQRHASIVESDRPSGHVHRTTWYGLGRYCRCKSNILAYC